MGTEEKIKKKRNDKKKLKRAEGKNLESERLDEGPPKKQKKTEKGPSSKPAKPVTGQSKKSPPENALPRLDPKSVGYFRRVGETLQQGFGSDEDRGKDFRGMMASVFSL